MTPEQENKLLKEFLYCTKRSCNNCGKVNCENFQRQRIDCCGLWVSYKDYIKELEKENAELSMKRKAERKIFQGIVEKKKDQLAQAKEIIKKLVDGIRVISDPKVELTDVNSFVAEAEQFLKGENIILEDAQAGNSPFDADEVFNKEMKAYPEEKVKKEKEK
jgi:hypothetical protein